MAAEMTLILLVRSRYLSRLLNLSSLRDAKSIYSGKLSERTPKIVLFSLLRDALFFRTILILLNSGSWEFLPRCVFCFFCEKGSHTTLRNSL